MRTKKLGRHLAICFHAIRSVWYCVEREETIVCEDGYLFIE